jgi:hypothetical protein
MTGTRVEQLDDLADRVTRPLPSGAQPGPGVRLIAQAWRMVAAEFCGVEMTPRKVAEPLMIFTLNDGFRASGAAGAAGAPLRLSGGRSSVIRWLPWYGSGPIMIYDAVPEPVHEVTSFRLQRRDVEVGGCRAVSQRHGRTPNIFFERVSERDARTRKPTGRSANPFRITIRQGVPIAGAPIPQLGGYEESAQPSKPGQVSQWGIRRQGEGSEIAPSISGVGVQGDQAEPIGIDGNAHRVAGPTLAEGIRADGQPCGSELWTARQAFPRSLLRVSVRIQNFVHKRAQSRSASGWEEIDSRGHGYPCARS